MRKYTHFVKMLYAEFIIENYGVEETEGSGIEEL